MDTQPARKDQQLLPSPPPPSVEEKGRLRRRTAAEAIYVAGKGRPGRRTGNRNASVSSWKQSGSLGRAVARQAAGKAEMTPETLIAALQYVGMTGDAALGVIGNHMQGAAQAVLGTLAERLASITKTARGRMIIQADVVIPHGKPKRLLTFVTDTIKYAHSYLEDVAEASRPGDPLYQEADIPTTDGSKFFESLSGISLVDVQVDDDHLLSEALYRSTVEIRLPNGDTQSWKGLGREKDEAVMEAFRDMVKLDLKIDLSCEKRPSEDVIRHVVTANVRYGDYDESPIGTSGMEGISERYEEAVALAILAAISSRMSWHILQAFVWMPKDKRLNLEWKQEK